MLSLYPTFLLDDSLSGIVSQILLGARTDISGHASIYFSASKIFAGDKTAFSFSGRNNDIHSTPVTTRQKACVTMHRTGSRRTGGDYRQCVLTSTPLPTYLTKSEVGKYLCGGVACQALGQTAVKDDRSGLQAGTPHLGDNPLSTWRLADKKHDAFWRTSACARLWLLAPAYSQYARLNEFGSYSSHGATNPTQQHALARAGRGPWRDAMP
ncbi:hypothetical protein BC628DRAFT_157151 [Trametes gibbosa]|nr:hypothetical protein BC628DRAFT_157151 [Trametes gibbosa]